MTDTGTKLPELLQEYKRLGSLFDEAVDGEAHYTDIDRILDELEAVRVRVTEASTEASDAVALNSQVGLSRVWYGRFKKLYHLRRTAESL